MSNVKYKKPVYKHGKKKPRKYSPHDTFIIIAIAAIVIAVLLLLTDFWPYFY